MSPNIAIRPLDAPGVTLAIEWAAREGWNPGLDDAAPFRLVDPDGFLGLFVGEEMAACISAVIYDESFAFIGFYICRADLRGRGYGKKLWDAALARLQGRTIGLDGVLAQQANYAASGFVLAHRNIRYSGRPSANGPRPSALVEIGDGAPDNLIDRIAAYDRPLFPARRDDFVRAWVRPPGRRTLVFVEGGAVRGYGAIRPCREGFKVAPLFADDEGIAEKVFAALVDPVGGAPVILDAPEPNTAARRLAERFGLSPTFETARMYRGAIPSLPLERIFGITSFELG